MRLALCFLGAALFFLGGCTTFESGSDQDAVVSGCSDGSREAFNDIDAEPSITGCAGGFELAGITTSASRKPQCGRNAGNDSDNKNGDGCSVEDLCAEGWHLCSTSADVAASAASGACPNTGAEQFWLTRQAQDPTGTCVDGGSNNLVGCGGSGVGRTPMGNSCAPLMVEMAWTECDQLGDWECGNSAQANTEADVVVKPTPDKGGALCCAG